VKSVRAGNISLTGAFITAHDGGAVLTNATIPPWQVKNAPATYDPTRSRPVLLNRTELKRLTVARQSRGLTVIPLRVYTKGRRIKLELALARGRRKYDKRERLKARDLQREVDRVLRGKDG